MADLPKTIAGKYEIRGVLGEGGTGIVYDAVRTSDGKNLALKVMHAEFAGDPQIRGRFQREAAILRRLEGPHVCPILDFGEVESIVYLALPRIEGPSLEQLMKEKLLDVDRAIDILIQVCVALRSAHAQGVIHRDLKPANVLLENGEKVVVVDFGMSKIVTGSGTGTTGLTAHNMVFGTPEYMSPEQARGEDLDARCDVYAVGVMLYEMLTGTPPFTGPTPLVVLTAHLTSELELPSKRAPAGRVTPALESVVLHALARDRDRRYPTAAALSSAMLHARAEPEDVESLRPEAFATNPAGSIAFARTIPAAASSSPRAVVQADEGVSPSSATMPSNAPPAPRPRSTVPSASVPPPADPSERLWLVLWIVAAIASIAAGVYFALR